MAEFHPPAMAQSSAWNARNEHELDLLNQKKTVRRAIYLMVSYLAVNDVSQAATKLSKNYIQDGVNEI